MRENEREMIEETLNQTQELFSAEFIQVQYPQTNDNTQYEILKIINQSTTAEISKIKISIIEE